MGLGWHPIYEMENKSHVPNHQPASVSFHSRSTPDMLIVFPLQWISFLVKPRDSTFAKHQRVDPLPSSKGFKQNSTYEQRVFLWHQLCRSHINPMARRLGIMSHQIDAKITSKYQNPRRTPSGKGPICPDMEKKHGPQWFTNRCFFMFLKTYWGITMAQGISGLSISFRTNTNPHV